MLKYPKVPTMRVMKILTDLNFHVSCSLNAEFTEEQAKVLANLLAIETLSSNKKETSSPKPKPQEQQAKKHVVNAANPQNKTNKKKTKNKKQINLPKAPVGYDYPRVKSNIPFHYVKKEKKPHVYMIKKKEDDVHERFIKMTLPGVFLPIASYDAIKSTIKSAENRMCLDSNLLLHIYYHLAENKMLQKFFLNNVVEKYVKTKILTKATRYRGGRIYDDQLLQIYNAANNVESESAFDIMKPKEFILNWYDVTFGTKYITINPPKIGNIKFAPLSMQNDMSIPPLNAIKEFLQERMPKIHCVAKENKLTVIDDIDLSIALRYLKIKSTKPALNPDEDGLKENLKEERKVIPTFHVEGFEDALSQASKFDKIELAKLKSKYISYLSSKQLDNYKVIPCNEKMSYLSTTFDNGSEPAFIFTLPSSKLNYIVLAVENLNIDRSTMLFSFRRRHYERALHGIFDYLQSYISNKRSELRRWESFGLGGIEIEYHAVNHRSSDHQYSWYEVLKYRLRTM